MQVFDKERREALPLLFFYIVRQYLIVYFLPVEIKYQSLHLRMYNIIESCLHTGVNEYVTQIECLQ